MKGKPIPYSPEELAWLEARKTAPRPALHAAFVARFGRSDVSLENLKRFCLRKGWTTGRTGRFEKGQAPVNKGKTMPWHPNSAATRFQKGARPHSYRGPGHESIDKKDGYVWLIVAETNPHTGAATRRVMKHKWLWEKAHGPIPEGHCLKCRTSDKTNCDPSNWALIPRALLPRLNGRFGRSYEDAPDELKPVILEIARLEHAAREKRNPQ